MDDRDDPATTRRWTDRGTAIAVIAVTAATAVAVALASSGVTGDRASAPVPTGNPPGIPIGMGLNWTPVGNRPSPAAATLVSFRSCAALLAEMRAQTARHVTGWGLTGTTDTRVYNSEGQVMPTVAAAGTAKSDAAPEHSTTNNQEHGVDEPDTVQTDGRRIVSISAGVLRVVDVARHTITGTLDLTMYGGSGSAQLLMRGDRVLVLMSDAGAGIAVVDRTGPAESYPGGSSGTTAVLVTLAAEPSVVGTFHTNGGYLAARKVDGTVRVVVGSSPRIALPANVGRVSAAERKAADRAAVTRAPMSAWLPSYVVSSGGRTATHTVPCSAVAHPKRYSGLSMLSVYTIDLADGLDGLKPVSIAADGATAYATASDLYVASSGYANTDLHRFDISGTAAPRYLASTTVPGRLQDSYSMSQDGSALRVVTTSGSFQSRSASTLYVLDSDTLRILSHVGGLGRGEQLHAVRFLGALAYVVTFKSVDPLYVLDLTDPAHPRTAGELKVTGYSDYLHPTSTGRLLGVGQDVHTNDEGNAVVSGLQVSLFDVTDPAHPRRVARVVRAHTPSETAIDSHAFLYWPQAHTAVVPIDSWNQSQSGAALVLRVGNHDLRVAGTIRNPVGAADDGGGIERTLVVGEEIWTMSNGGLAASNLHTLSRQAWIAFA